MKKIIVPILFCSALFGQQTYNLRGSGYSEGMRLLGRAEFSADMQTQNEPNQSIHMVINSDTHIVNVDKNGVPQKLEITSHISGLPDEDNGKKLEYVFDGTKYTLVSVNGAAPDKSTIESSGSLPSVDDRSMNLPAYPVPVGYEWDLPISSVMNLVASMGINLPPEVAHTLSGGLKYKLNEVAGDTYKVTLKGKVTSSGSKDLPPGKAVVTIVTLRDVQTGLQRQADITFSCNFKGMKMDGEGKSTIDIIP